MIRQLLSLTAAFLPSVLLLAESTPSPALLVLNKEENTLAIVHPDTGRVAARVPTGNGPHEIAVSADGRTAFVTNYGTGSAPGNSLSVIDLRAQKESRADLSPMQRPHGIDYRDGRVYFSAEGNLMVGGYDPSAKRTDFLLGTGQQGTHMVLAGRDANTLYTTNMGSDSVSVLENASGAWRATVVPVGKGPEALDLSPDGRELWVAHSRDGSVSVIDTASKKVVATIGLKTRRSNRLKFTRDGKQVLVSDLSGGELVVVDAATRTERKRIRMGNAPEGILMHPDGKTAFVAVAGDNHVAVLDLSRLEVVRKIETGKGPDGMAWATVVP